jgi:hypothetical protein
VVETRAEAVPEAAPAPAAVPRAPQTAALAQRRAPAAKAAAVKVPADEESQLAAEAAGRAANGDSRGALALHRRLLSLREQRYGPHALTAAHARLDLGLDLIALGDVEAGRAEVRSALAALSRGFFSREPEVFASELRALDGPRHPAPAPTTSAPGRPSGAAPSGGHGFPDGNEPAPGVRTVR